MNLTSKQRRTKRRPTGGTSDTPPVVGGGYGPSLFPRQPVTSRSIKRDWLGLLAALTMRIRGPVTPQSNSAAGSPLPSLPFGQIAGREG
jgi:hypothetical protein